MALLDFLKRKKDVAKSKKPEKKAASVRRSPEDEGDQKKPASAPLRHSFSEASKATARRRDFSFEAVERPHVSEKGTILSEKQNQYIFEVAPKFSKQEIKKSIEGVYGVNVLSVNTVKIPAKKRRLGRTQGFRKGYKKAIVKIAKGQKIEIL
jgi:large subunit ribosomal protein L23